MANDPFDLQRFIDAQESVYTSALSELRRGRKRGHWMWFIFPQAHGLGHSAMAKLYAIGSLAEARAYLAHPILGARLRECVEALQDLSTCSAAEVFGDADALKLRSSLTLFALAHGGPIFETALSKWFGSMDQQTRILLAP